MVEKRTIKIWGDDSKEMKDIREKLSEEFNVEYVLTASNVPVISDNGNLTIGVGNIRRDYSIRD